MNVLNTRLLTNTVIQANGAIPVGNVIHKSGCALSAGGTSWSIQGSGYYDVVASITLAPVGTTVTTVSLLNNGSVIATASAVPTAADSAVNLCLVGVVYSKCCCANNTLTIQVDNESTVTEADVVIERI